MKKDELLKGIAETGYNVGFGAKKPLRLLTLLIKLMGVSV